MKNMPCPLSCPPLASLARLWWRDKTPPADPAPAPPEVDAAAAQQAVEQPAVEPEKDAHGCMPSAGQTWSTMRNECVQIFDAADIQPG